MIMIFSIFPGGKFAQLGTFSGVGWGGRLKFVFRYHIFFQGIELFKVKFQGIYESNNHLF